MSQKENVQWHSAFYAAAELAFRKYSSDLTFYREEKLTKLPLRMDLLIIKKENATDMDNHLGKIFRTYNVIEYKSPSDSLNIDDFYKVNAYASVYKTFGNKVNAIDGREITVTLFHDTFPKKLMERLIIEGFSYECVYPGIYYLSGNRLMYPAQIVVGKELSQENNVAFRILREHAKISDLDYFVKEAISYTETGDITNADAIFYVSSQRNQSYFSRYGGGVIVCEAIRELFKDEIAVAVENAVKEVERTAEIKVKEAEKTAETKVKEAEKIAEIKVEEAKKETENQVFLGLVKRFFAMGKGISEISMELGLDKDLVSKMLGFA